MVDTSVNPTSCQFELNDITLEGLRWGEGRPIKVLALHGWLDNAASFSMLAPLLSNMDIVSLDLAGHGKSRFRAGNSAYNIWQDLIEIGQVAEILNWPRFSMIGHSRGAMIASLYAGTFPEQISGLCLIDAITPGTIAEKELPQQLARSIKSMRLVFEKRSTYFGSFDEAALARTRGTYPLTVEASRLLAERAVNECPNQGFYWRYDKRLLVASEIRLSEAQVRAFVDAFPCVAKVILAKGGFVHESESEWFRYHPKLDIDELNGEHHLQLSGDANTIISLANVINEYFSSI